MLSPQSVPYTQVFQIRDSGLVEFGGKNTNFAISDMGIQVLSLALGDTVRDDHSGPSYPSLTCMKSFLGVSEMS